MTQASTTAQAHSNLYQSLAVLDKDRHQGHRCAPVKDWGIARDMNAVFVSALEFGDVAREYPIAFVPIDQDDQGRPVVTPVALLGLRDRDNVYVSADGRWDASYLPAFLRRYPFAYVRTGDSPQVSLALDEAWSGWASPDGERLLEESGEPTPYLKSMTQFLDRFEEEVLRTRLMCARLVELELLRSGEVKGQLENGMDVNATGFFMIDEAKLAQLPDEVVLELHRNGILGLIHTHLVSMGQVHALARRMMARPG